MVGLTWQTLKSVAKTISIIALVYFVCAIATTVFVLPALGYLEVFSIHDNAEQVADNSNDIALLDTNIEIVEADLLAVMDQENAKLREQLEVQRKALNAVITTSVSDVAEHAVANSGNIALLSADLDIALANAKKAHEELAAVIKENDGLREQLEVQRKALNAVITHLNERQ